MVAQQQEESKQLRQQQVELRAEVVQQQKMHQRALQEKAADAVKLLQLTRFCKWLQQQLHVAEAQNDQLKYSVQQAQVEHDGEIDEEQAAHGRAMDLLQKARAAMEALEADVSWRSRFKRMIPWSGTGSR